MNELHIFQNENDSCETQHRNGIKSHSYVTKKDLKRLKEQIMSKISEFAQRENVLDDKINAAIDSFKSSSVVTPSDQLLLDSLEVRTQEIANRLDVLNNVSGSVTGSIGNASGSVNGNIKGHFVGKFNGTSTNFVDGAVLNSTDSSIDGNLFGVFTGASHTGSLNGSYTGSYVGIPVVTDNGSTNMISGSLNGTVNGIYISTI